MSLALLWAVLFHSTVTYACDSAQVAQNGPASIAQGHPAGCDHSDTDLQSGKLYLIQKSTTTARKFNLLPGTTDTKSFAFRLYGHQATTPFTARTPGDNFFCQFYYTSSQPQAP